MSPVASPVPTGITAVQARIAEIQTRFNGATATSNSFADVLSSVLGGSNDPSSLSTGGSVSGADVVSDASKYLGVPYQWGGTDPSKGLDCSGLVQRVYGDLGIQLPRVAADQARQGTAVPSLAQAQPGDLVAFGSPVDHIGIYIGNNKMIVAPHRGDVVKIQDVYTTPTAIRRILPAGTSFSAPSATGGIPASLSSQYNNLFLQASSKYGISASVLAAVAKQESGFNASVSSGAGAQGLMQLMPGTARSLGVNAFDPAQAVDGAARMLSGLVKQFGSIDLALAAYNAGPGAVQKYGGIPPYKETQSYVRNVLAMSR